MKHLQEYVDWVKLTKKYHGNDAIYLGSDSLKEKYISSKERDVTGECVELQITYPSGETMQITVREDKFAAQVVKDILLLGGANKELLEDYGRLQYEIGCEDSW